MAKPAAAGPHPEPDVLNAYAEQALSPEEDTQVAGHLAMCAECRTVMFLAHSAANEPVEVPESPAPVRVTWFRWALPATAALAIVIALVSVKQAGLRQQTPAATQEAVAISQKTADQTPSAETGRANRNRDEGVQARKAELKTRNEVTASPTKILHQKAIPTTHAKAVAVPAAAPPPPGALDRVAAAAPPQTPAKTTTFNAMSAAPMANMNVQSANSTANGPSQQRMQNQAAASAVDVTSASESVEVTAVDNKATPAAAAAASPQATFKSSGAMAYSDTSAEMTAKRSTLGRMASQVWRISADGHLERMIQNQWHRALNGVQKSFRVVAYVQDHVWAGGSGPELFHSADGGENWNTLKVKTADGELNGTMQTIRASDAQHLAIIADDGSTWVTADGGQTWAKQQ